MKNLFEEEIIRKGTDSKKWDLDGMYTMADFVDKESIPMWIADMDFKVPDFLIEKLEKRIKEGVFGYNIAKPEYFESVKYWMKKKHNWEVETNWIVPTAGVVSALCYAIKGFTKKGDGIIVQTPVYPPFMEKIITNKRKLVENKLKLVDGRYEIDFKDLEKKCKKSKNKMLILCSPHNPVGRVWSEEELDKLVKICSKNNVIIVSDEIHSDLILFENKFISLGKYENKLKKKFIVCTSVAKTFNVAGFSTSNIVIPCKKLKKKFLKEMEEVGVNPSPNIFGNITVKAVYTTEGQVWLNKLIKHLEENYNFLKTYLEKNIPEIKCLNSEGTYLAWLDFRDLKLSNEELKDKMEKEAKIVLDPGNIFGKEGAQFMRLNFACSRTLLERALERIKKTFKK